MRPPPTPATPPASATRGCTHRPERARSPSRSPAATPATRGSPSSSGRPGRDRPAIRLPRRGRTGQARGMPDSAVGPPYDQFLATAEAVAAARPEVDPEMAREVFQEAATLLYNGLALDGLDEHDASAVVAGLCVDLVAQDPGAAIRARSRAALAAPGDLHDPEGVSAAYLMSVALFQL